MAPSKLAERGDDPQARRERRKEARPGELLDAALDLFVEKGFAATRAEEVAARAGVSKGTLFLYFQSKEDLFKAVVQENLSVRFVEWNAEYEDVSHGDLPTNAYIKVFGYSQSLDRSRISEVSDTAAVTSGVIADRDAIWATDPADPELGTHVFVAPAL